jgi:hypothetical protein
MSQDLTVDSSGNDGNFSGQFDDPTLEAIHNFEQGKAKLPHVTRLDEAMAQEHISDTLLGTYRVEEQHSVPEGFAAQVISTVRERGSAYGTPAENHQTTADMLSSWLSRRFKQPLTLTAEDVIAINVIQKISRLANVSKDDSWLDVAGYTENVAMLRGDQRNFRVDAKRLDKEIRVGDVVVLIESDRTRKMTVEGIAAAWPICVWFDIGGRQLWRSSYKLDELEFVAR